MPSKITLFLTVFVLFIAAISQAQTYTQPVVDEPAFSRYTEGAECAQASKWLESRFWRDKRHDTLYVSRTGNPPQRSTIETVRKCIARFNLSNTAQRDIIGLLQAFLVAENESQADASAARLVIAFGKMPASVRAWILYQITDVYLDVSQPQIKKAEKHISMLDAMGASAVVERMLAHKRLANVARLRDSVPLWKRELDAALVASKQMVGDARKEYARESADIYMGIADLKARTNDPQGAILTIETALAELVPLRSSLASYLTRDASYHLMGKAAPPVQATHWYNTGGNKVYPAPGKPTLLVHVSHNCGSLCYPKYGVLRRLRAKFESKGLNIVLMTRTQGFYRNRLVKPDSESIYINNYFNDIVQLPVSLAVWEADFGRRGDGKLTVLSDPNSEAYPARAFLVDSHGKIRLTFDTTRDNEVILENVIASLLGFTGMDKD